MATNDVEPMDVDNDPKLPLPHPGYSTRKEGGGSKDELRVSVSTAEDFEPKKLKYIITTALQTWANKNSIKGEFTVTEISDDGRTAVISVTPAEALKELLNLSGKKLMTKDQKSFFTLTPIKEVEQTEDDKKASGEYSSLTQQKAQNGSVEMNDDFPEDDKKDPPCLVALGPYWYMTNMYPEKIRRIERENRVKFTENVAVTINAEKKNANPKKASDEFIQLAQKCIDESKGASIPLKGVGSEEWWETLKSLKTTDRKCQITISSDEITVFGPPEYQRALIKSLQSKKVTTSFPEEVSYPEKGSHKMATNFTDEERANEEFARVSIKSHKDRKSPARVKVSSSFKDPFVTDGLPVEGHYWEVITNLYMTEVDQIQDKFNVRFRDSDSAFGQKTIKVRYNKSERNVSMESHAIRALLRLYQKAALSQMRRTNRSSDDEVDLYGEGDDTRGATARTSQDRGEDKSSKGLAEGRDEKKNKGAEAMKDEKEDTCPVCIDTFKQKKTLKCKHEFCEECLEQSIKSIGPTCPICKDVFGVMEGDQPDGTMTWHTSPSPLPGFYHFGTIEIHYDIPSGYQKANHPNPGQRYHGTQRTAYLPDTKEGNEVLMLLKKAFDQRLIFTVGTSRTSGMDNVVTWNDIHHKTSTHGGAEGYGYPDPGYLSRVKEELKAQGIK